MDAAVNWAYQLCENRNRYKDGPDAEEFMNKPHECGTVVIQVTMEKDFRDMVASGTFRNGRVIEKDSLPRKRFHRFKLRIDCDNLPEKNLPSEIYGLIEN